ncbi:MAG TPA: hypothetical protein VGM41_16395 [Chitinophagaceae bacterium]|jgi:hypothetical protein
MQNSLKHLCPAQEQALANAIQKISAATRAERIYCFGHRSNQMYRWSPHHAGPTAYNSSTFNFYDLLLVMPDGDIGYKQRIARLEHLPEIRFTNFNYHFISSFELNRRLQEDDPFTIKLCHEAVLLHHTPQPPKGGVVTNEFAQQPERSTGLSKSSKFNWERDMNLAHRSYRKAERYATDHQSGAALLALHESALYACGALIRLHTGQWPESASLVFLLNYCDNFCLIRTRVFPANTAEETALLQMIDGAVTAEAGTLHNTPEHIIDILLKRTDKMLQLAESLYYLKGGKKEKIYLKINQDAE